MEIVERKKKVMSFCYSQSYKRSQIHTYLSLKYAELRRMLKRKPHLSHIKEIEFTKEQFVEWCLANNHFIFLYNQYKLSNYKYSLCPTIDRINKSMGYSIENIQWLTRSESASLSNISRKRIKETL